MQSRRSLRLDGYDYRQNGAYFVTVCAYRHACLFGTVVDGVMIPSEIGTIIAEEWHQTAKLRPYVGLDTFVVMPNHVHGVIVIDECEPPTIRCGDNGMRNGVNPRSLLLQAKSLGAIIGRFKGSVTKRARSLPQSGDLVVWQRNFHDHVIRNERSLHNIRRYVNMNPARWAEDSYFTE